MLNYLAVSNVAKNVVDLMIRVINILKPNAVSYRIVHGISLIVLQIGSVLYCYYEIRNSAAFDRFKNGRLIIACQVQSIAGELNRTVKQHAVERNLCRSVSEQRIFKRNVEN